MGVVSPEALVRGVSSSLEKMVTKVEGGLSGSWPVDSLEVWAPSVDEGPQIELRPGWGGVRRRGGGRYPSDGSGLTPILRSEGVRARSSTPTQPIQLPHPQTCINRCTSNPSYP